MDELTPAQRYALDRERRALAKSAFGRFAEGQPYPLDDFQRDGCVAIERGAGVLVAAPTGAGKTVVGEFAIFLALEQGRRAFYTTPIKALSNQKYHDLVREHGADRVGLLTGDTSINGDAPVVVMTTEVLRNMLYADSRALDTLGYVVMDEVHYLADRFRGPVWEEVILRLAASVQLVALSATVSNVEEFGDWLKEVRGDMAIVVSDHRPVPLWQHVVTYRGGGSGEDSPTTARLIDLYAYRLADPADTAQFTRGAQRAVSPDDLVINPELVAALRTRNSNAQTVRADYPGRGSDGRHGGRGHDRGGAGRSGRDGRRGGGRRGAETRWSHGDAAGGPAGRRRRLSRFSVVDLLAEEDLLPAIYFIFSRAGCEQAVEQCLAAGLHLTSPQEQAEIRRVIDERLLQVAPADLAALNFNTWALALERGIAAHHAGLLPLFKETVEHLFVSGLVKVVFATETLALGINMPARTVVLEKLVKWDGSAHVEVTPGEYTQLTGRAGRRGIDVEGHAVVVDNPGLDPQSLVGLASTRTYPLRSSFRPTYNMSANLVATVGAERTRDVLEMSFAQYQADRSVVGLARQAAEQDTALEGYARAMHCDRGDFREYHELSLALSKREKAAKSERGKQNLRAVSRQIERLTKGDVIEVRSRRRGILAVVLDRPELALEGAQVAVLSDGRVKYLGPADAPDGFEVLGRVRVPKGFSVRNRGTHKEVSQAALAVARQARGERNAAGGAEGKSRRGSQDARQGSAGAQRDPEIARLRERVKSHPCHDCPERADHERWARRYSSLHAEHDRLVRRISGRTGTIGQRFDKVCAVLETLGYVQRGVDGLELTESGVMLRRLYNEKDLLIAQCLRGGVWDGLKAPQLAAVVAATVYEGRRDTGGSGAIPGGPQGALATALDETFRVWSRLEDLEEDTGLEPTARPEFGIVGPVHRWAAGRSLEATLKETELAAGDFVRWCKQVLDVLDQVAQVAPKAELRTSALGAMDAIRRGVVAYSGL